MTTIIIQIIVIVILIVLSSFFSSSETALTTISPHRLKAMVQDGLRGAGTLEKVLSNKEKMLSVVLICNNIVNLTASSLSTIVVQKLFGNMAVSIGTGVLTLIVLIFGEIAPKTLATYRAEKLALRYAGIIYVLMVVLGPLAVAVNVLAKGVMRLMGFKKGEHRLPITQSELRNIVEVSNKQGVIENEEKVIIDNIFDFQETVAREVMVPRINVTSVRIDSTYQEITEIFRQNFFTRLPVFDEEEEEIVGIVNVKDLVFYDPAKIPGFRVADIMREAEYTFEQKRVAELFYEMKKSHAGMMVVLDEYGDVAGIITMEDIVEEIVGDIQDEFDANEAKELVKAGAGEYMIHGHMSLDDVNDQLGTDLESEDYDSIGGLMIEKMSRIPVQGDKVDIGNITLTAYKVDHARIELVKLTIHPEEVDDAQEEA